MWIRRLAVLLFITLVASCVEGHDVEEDFDFDSFGIDMSDDDATQPDVKTHKSNKASGVGVDRMSEVGDGEDDFEYDGIEVGAPDGTKTPQSKHYEPRRVPPLPRDPLSLAHQYWSELVFLILLHIVGAHIYVGKGQNEEIAMKWVKQTEEFFSSQFAQTGLDSKTAILSRGWNKFEGYATGRRHCSYCLQKIECLPRQCPWYLWGLCTLFPAHDSVDLEIPLDTMQDSFIFAIGGRHYLKYIQKKNEDVNGCCSLKLKTGLCSDLLAMADNSEVTDKLINSEVLRHLNAAAGVIRFIIVSDELAAKRKQNHKFVMRVQLVIDDMENRPAELTTALQAVFALVDLVPFVTLTEKAKVEVRKARQNLSKIRLQETEEERAEELAKKREDKAIEEEERVLRMSPEQQRKHEEKLTKKQMKARQPKIKIK